MHFADLIFHTSVKSDNKTADAVNEKLLPSLELAQIFETDVLSEHVYLWTAKNVQAHVISTT